MTNLLRNLSRRKTIPILANTTEAEDDFKKTLTIYDLIFLGVGSTLGVGIYILSGEIAKDVAGPAVIISFLIAAVASVFAGLCFAEFAAFAPTSGSIYTYCYLTLGEFIAFIMGWNLITEYVIGAASVVKALSVYLDSFVNNTIETYLRSIYEIDVPFLSQYFDAFAFLICIVFAVALSFGMKESVKLNNILSGVNALLVLFFIIIGFTKVNFGYWNLEPFEVPKNAGTGGFFPYGLSGVIKGAGSCIFGFLGFDCIATTGCEVKRPEKTLPVAIIISLAIVFFAYFGVSTIVTLLVPYYMQDTAAPLTFAFGFVGYHWAKWIITAGSLFGFFGALFGAFFPVSRIIYTMANDGLLFQTFSKVNKRFNTPVAGTILTGVVTGFTAAILDVEHLINLNSIGTLLSYTVISLCVIILRYSVDEFQANGETKPLVPSDSVIYFKIDDKLNNNENFYIPKYYTNKLVCFNMTVFCIFSVFMSCVLNYVVEYDFYLISFILFFMILPLIIIRLQPTYYGNKSVLFKVPFIPFLPSLSIFINIYLMIQFDVYTWLRLLFWLVMGLVIYFSYGIFNSHERHRKY